jgi:hypothetical protein
VVNLTAPLFLSAPRRAAQRRAAARRRARSSIAAEVARLAVDETDRVEMRTIREQMAELAPESLN